MSRAYRHRMTVQRDDSSAGQQTPNYIDQSCRIPCRFIPKSVYESRRGRQLEAGVSHVVELHWYDNLVNPNDRLKNEHTGQLLDVIGVINVDGRGRQMIIKANEVV